MPTAPILNIDDLLQPIPGDDPAGEPLPDTVRIDLNEFRKEPIENDPETANFKPEWAKIIRIATDTLTNKSKHLEVAARLLEALTKRDGIPGLRDGLKLLARLNEECWDRIYPKPDEEDGLEIRFGPLQWFNDRTSKIAFPQSVGACPLLYTGSQVLSYHDWISPSQQNNISELLTKIDSKKLRITYDDLCSARDALQSLSNVLNEKMGYELAPNYLGEENPDNLGTAINKCLDVVTDVARRRGIPLSDEVAAESSAGSSSDSPSPADTSQGGSSSIIGMARDRDGLYRQLQLIAESLRRLEPHSPIPYLIDRCVRMGSLPFPELMRDIIRTVDALNEIDVLLGLPKASEPGSHDQQ